MDRVGATYIGGYPGGSGADAAGELVRSHDELTHSWSRMGQALNNERGGFSIPLDEILAVSVEDVDPLRTMRSAATWTWWGGVAGGLLASDASALRVVALRCRHAERESTALFACPDLGARNFVDQWQRDRHAAGLPRLPSIENLHPNPIEAQQLELLHEISAKLDRLLDALERPT